MTETIVMDMEFFLSYLGLDYKLSKKIQTRLKQDSYDLYVYHKTPNKSYLDFEEFTIADTICQQSIIHSDLITFNMDRSLKSRNSTLYPIATFLYNNQDEKDKQ